MPEVDDFGDPLHDPAATFQPFGVNITGVRLISSEAWLPGEPARIGKKYRVRYNLIFPANQYASHSIVIGNVDVFGRARQYIKQVILESRLLPAAWYGYNIEPSCLRRPPSVVDKHNFLMTLREAQRVETSWWHDNGTTT